MAQVGIRYVKTTGPVFETTLGISIKMPNYKIIQSRRCKYEFPDPNHYYFWYVTDYLINEKKMKEIDEEVDAYKLPPEEYATEPERFLGILDAVQKQYPKTEITMVRRGKTWYVSMRHRSKKAHRFGEGWHPHVQMAVCTAALRFFEVEGAEL